MELEMYKLLKKCRFSKRKFVRGSGTNRKAGRAVHSRTVFISSHMVCSVGSVRRLLKEQEREMAPMAAASRPYRYGSTYRVRTSSIPNITRLLKTVLSFGGLQHVQKIHKRSTDDRSSVYKNPMQFSLPRWVRLTNFT